MRSNYTNKFLLAAALGAAALGLAQAAAAAATANVALTAQRATAALPDGSAVPMWGYCYSASSTNVTGGAACPLTTPATLPTWTTGPTITVAAGDTLNITLTNSLPVPTSVVILGQQGGGLGTGITRAAGPAHNGQPAATWPAVDTSVSFAPPAQGLRALSFAPEAGAATGTYTYTWNSLKPGTYIYETGSRPSLQVPMGLYGTLIVTSAPTPAVPAAGTVAAVPLVAGAAYPAYTDAYGITHTPSSPIPYDADAAMLFSEIDPKQNTAVDAAALSHAGQPNAWEVEPFNSKTAAGVLACTATTPCYPPAVNYSPRFFLINGQAFNPTSPQSLPIPADVVTGNVLVRFANAGLRTHVPSVTGATFSLVAEDGNLAPGNPKIQSEVLLTAGKTYDVLMQPGQSAVGGPYAPATLSVFDRALNLTTNNTPFGGMQALIRINGSGAAAGAPGGVPTALSARAVNDVFTVAAGGVLTGNVRTNDFGVVSVVGTAPSAGTLALNADGTFTFTPGTFVGTATFTYTGLDAGGLSTAAATVTITVGSIVPPTAVADVFGAPQVRVAGVFTAAQPGVLANDTSATNLALTAVLDNVTTNTCTSVDLKPNGSFTAASGGAASCQFTYHAVDAQGTSSTPVTATINFPAGSGLKVAVLDTQTRQPIPGAAGGDYSWVIEQDMTFQHSGDPALGAASNTLATNFHASYMPLIAAGCTGPRSCGNSNTVLSSPITPRPPSFPGDVNLDFSKGQHYYLSVAPADASDGALADPTTTPPTPTTIGHGMGGAQILGPASSALAALGKPDITVLTPQNPLPVANLSVYVFEDNTPTNGDVDEGEQGLGGFQINIFDVRGSSGDAAGQMTYDLAGMPLTNTLFGKPGCPYSDAALLAGKDVPVTIGTIYTCPNAPTRAAPKRSDFPTGQAGTRAYRQALAAYQARVAQDAIDYKLAGMALVPNMIPGRFTVEAIPNTARTLAGEKWVQVSTLEGGKPVDTFIKAGEPAYWQEFGSPGFHSFIGFMNPAHVLQTQAQVGGKETLTGVISSLHMDRPPAANLNDSCVAATGAASDSCRAAMNYTTCYVSLNTGTAGTGQNVSYGECDAQGNFTLYKVPAGQHELVIWDQWLDQIIAKKQITVPDTGGTKTTDVGHIPVFTWFTRVEQKAFIDLNKDGVWQSNEPGISKIPMNVRFRDGSISNFLSTDGDGVASANELFPLFNWYVIESDTTRYKGTGVNVIYDAGGVPDKADLSQTTLLSKGVANSAVPTTGILNSTETYPLDAAHQVPGATYTPGKTARIDPGTTLTEGLQGFINQTAIINWGKTPYSVNETGGIMGLVYYASTRGFDDPRFEVQFSWEPAIPRVPVALYAETKNADGTVSYTLVDQTTTSSWDDWANGTHLVNGVAIPNLNCPGQTTDPFSTVALGGNLTKCYDGQHVFNQVQPAVYDGRYRFPTSAANVTYLNANGTLKAGTYMVQVMPPMGYEIVKEEDKNILIGEPWNPLGQTQFLGVTNIYILPDQATLNSSNIPGGQLRFPVCVGAPHTVPDYLTVFPDNQQVAPYAGTSRPLCDKKEINLADQSQVSADFQLFTPTPVAAKFVGMMLNDAAAEFDPISPSFGEKAALPNAPISIRDFNGVEILRTYNDKWGTFNGLAPSTLAANVPNPSGYSPNMLTSCMNDPGPILDTRTGSSTFGQMIIDPMYNPMFSNFCYVWPYLPGSTVYLDTPVLPTAAFASASTYQPVDCQYPDATPAVKRVDGPAAHGPWILSTGSRTLTITALGDADVLNPAFAGPTAITAGTTASKIKRHYGFGASGTIAMRRISAGGVTTTTPIPLTNVSWSDLSIKADVPAIFAAGDRGELIITNATSGKTSVDTVTVSIESVAPTIVNPASVFAGDPTAPDSLNYPQPVQTAIDAAKPGDLIILEAGSYPELVVMWKPVRLQGVGAASVIINATKFPNRKVADWRGRINALFGVDPIADTQAPIAQADPLPGQTLTGGIVLLEPTVLSTEEGAGITVIASDPTLRGNRNCPALTGTGPVVTVDKTGQVTPDTVPLVTVSNPNRHWSNFSCAASRIDGVSVTGGDAGGGIYVNGWATGLEIANNRVFGNAGPFSGGVRIGQPYLEGAVNTGVNSDGSVLGYNKNVNIHHNAITTNGMVEGNAAAGATAAGGAGGGLSICSGTDNYKVNYNFICGNFASSDGGGIGHIGLSNNGSIAFNQILFNESYNQTSPQNGGGLVVEGETGAATAMSPGSGNVTIDANLIQGNFARSGNGGGLRLQGVNGQDLLCELNNDGCAENGNNTSWRIRVTNNIIVNNLSGAAGGGVSLLDSFGALFNNNTVAANDSTGIVGALFNTMVTVNGVATSTGPVTGVPSPAGIASDPTSAQLLASLTPAQRISRQVSTPSLVNNIIWQNRSFFFDAKRIDPVTKQIPLVASNHWSDAVTNGGAPLAAQTATGQCVNGATYWDLGVVGDQQPIAPPVVTLVIATASHPIGGTVAQQRTITAVTAGAHNLSVGDAIIVSGYTGTSVGYNTAAATVLSVVNATTFTYRVPAPPPTANPATANQGVLGGPALAAQARALHPTNSVLTPDTLALYNNAGQGNISGGSPAALFVKQYCNGSRVLPGVQFEPGTPFQPAFQLDAAATLDESGNFVDLHFGPISLGDPVSGATNGNYHLPNPAAPGYNLATVTNPANNHDIDNEVRPRAVDNGSGIDIGADQYSAVAAGTPGARLSPAAVNFGNVFVNTTSAAQTLTYTNIGTTTLTVATVTLGGTNPNRFAIPGDTCTGATLVPGAACTISVTFTPTAVSATARVATLTVTDTAGGAAAQSATLTGMGVGLGAIQFNYQGNPIVGTFAFGNSAASRTIAVTNTGTADMTFSALPGLSNTLLGEFSLTPAANNPCTAATVLTANGGTCRLTIARTRTAAGNATATLTLTDTGAAAATQVLNVSGT